MEQSHILAWTLVSECPIPPEIDQILTTGEVAIAAYKTFRDSAVFTNKRLIVRDAQGLTGKKVEIYSLPYSSVLMWSSENGAGMLNFNSELELWTKAGHIKVNLNKGLDIRRLDRLLSEAILGSTDLAGSLTIPALQSAPAAAPATATQSAPPPPPVPANLERVPEPGWLADPNGTHELRYWDGIAWTAHVCNAGVQSID